MSSISNRVDSFNPQPDDPHAAWINAGKVPFDSDHKPQFSALVRWLWSALVVRRDVHGAYFRDRDTGGTRTYTLTRDVLRSRGIEVDDEDSVLTPWDVADHLARDANSGPNKCIGVHTSTPNNYGRWVALDVDAHGDTSDAVVARNERFALAKYAELAARGANPLLLDYGKGSYHLWLPFPVSVRADVLYHFALSLTADYEAYGFDARARPESFPKQERASECGHWLRLPGRHHKRATWPRVWTGTAWVENQDAIDHITSIQGDDPNAVIPREFFVWRTESAKAAATVPTTLVTPHAPRREYDGRDDENTPWAQFDLRGTLEETGILARWTRNPDGRLCRPGKSGETSATFGERVGKRGEPLLHCFTNAAEAAPLQQNHNYGLFNLLKLFRFSGDAKAAVRWVRDRGFGDSRLSAAEEAHLREIDESLAHRLPSGGDPDVACAPFLISPSDPDCGCRKGAKCRTPKCGPTKKLDENVVSCSSAPEKGDSSDADADASHTSQEKKKSTGTTHHVFAPRRAPCVSGERVRMSSKCGGKKMMLRLWCNRWSCLTCGRHKKQERMQAMASAIRAADAGSLYVYRGALDKFEQLLGRLKSRIERRVKAGESIEPLAYGGCRPDVDGDHVVAVLVSPIDDRKGAMCKVTPSEALAAMRDAIGAIQCGPGASDCEETERHFRYSKGFCPPEKERVSQGKWVRDGVAKVGPEIAAMAYRAAGMSIVHLAPARNGVSPGEKPAVELVAKGALDCNPAAIARADAIVAGDVPLNGALAEYRDALEAERRSVPPPDFDEEFEDADYYGADAADKPRIDCPWLGRRPKKKPKPRWRLSDDEPGRSRFGEF